VKLQIKIQIQALKLFTSSGAVQLGILTETALNLHATAARASPKLENWHMPLRKLIADYESEHDNDTD